MIETPVVVRHSKGLDGRPIALLVQEASQYVSQIHIMVNGKKINAKKYYGNDESESCRRGRTYSCNRR